jgi:hypothetical protein
MKVGFGGCAGFVGFCLAAVAWSGMTCNIMRYLSSPVVALLSFVLLQVTRICPEDTMMQ